MALGAAGNEHEPVRVADTARRTRCRRWRAFAAYELLAGCNSLWKQGVRSTVEIFTPPHLADELALVDNHLSAQEDRLDGASDFGPFED